MIAHVDVTCQLLHEDTLFFGADFDVTSIADEVVVLERGRVLLFLLVGGGTVHRRALDVVLDMNLVLAGEHVAHDEQVVLLVLDGQPKHAQQVRQQRLALGLHNVLVVVLEHVVQTLDVLARDALDYVALVVRDVELGAALAAAAVQWLDFAVRERFHVRLLVDVQALAHALEHKRRVALDLVVTWQKFPEKKKKQFKCFK
jgi:hypothetical protein